MSKALRSFTYDGDSNTATMITEDYRTITATFDGSAHIRMITDAITTRPDQLTGEWKAEDHPGESLIIEVGLSVKGKVIAFEDSDVPDQPIPAAPESVQMTRSADSIAEAAADDVIDYVIKNVMSGDSTFAEDIEIVNGITAIIRERITDHV